MRPKTSTPKTTRGLPCKGSETCRRGWLSTRRQRQATEQPSRSYDRALQLAPGCYSSPHNNKGNALAKLGDLQAGLAKRAAEESYGAAIASYDRALQLAPEYIYAHNNKGLALQALGDLQAGLAKHGAAEESYGAAIASYDRALQLAPEYINAHNNKGLALQALGDLQAGLAKHGAAEESYRLAKIEQYKVRQIQEKGK